MISMRYFSLIVAVLALMVSGCFTANPEAIDDSQAIPTALIVGMIPADYKETFNLRAEGDLIVGTIPMEGQTINMSFRFFPVTSSFSGDVIVEIKPILEVGLYFQTYGYLSLQKGTYHHYGMHLKKKPANMARFKQAERQALAQFTRNTKLDDVYEVRSLNDMAAAYQNLIAAGLPSIDLNELTQ